MKLHTIVALAISAGSAAAFTEIGTYKNPNPRPYNNCDAADLIRLSTCCNDVLSYLDDCNAGDLACECCALQSMDHGCYNLCAGNPATNFLSVLLDDCVPLNDVNACNIPFKKVDGERESNYRHRNGDSAPHYASASFVSALRQHTTQEEEEEEVSSKPKINLIKSNETVVAAKSGTAACGPCAYIVTATMAIVVTLLT